MPGEKQADLRQKLAEMENLPEGFSFDKNAAWQKLSSALPQRRRPVRRRWFVAAAALLLCAGGWWLLPTSGVRKENATASPEPQKPAPVHPTLETHTAKMPISLRRVTPVKKMEKQKNKAIAGPVMKQEPVLLPVVFAPQPVVVDTVRRAVVLRPRFKVAHINELNQQPPSAESAKPLALRRIAPANEDLLPPAEDSRNETKNRTLLSSFAQRSQ